MDIQDKLGKVPVSPGIYIMKGAKEQTLYVGKAKNLRNRLRSYFQNSAALDDRKTKMVQEVRDLDYIVTTNELEALILEANFIKKAKPPYNIILRDDKNYPYLKLTVNEEWPRLEVVRKIEKDGALYFGPYVPSGSMREMLRFIRRNFAVRLCKYNLKKPFRPCVQYQMGRCLAPCSESFRGPAGRGKYIETVNDVRSFIKGEKKELLAHLRERMEKLSNNQEYEEAARIRDRLKALENVWESQGIIAPELGDMDVIGMYRESGDASIYMIFIRNGSIIGQKDFFLKKIGNIKGEELIEQFIEQFYSKEMVLPPRIILPLNVRLATQKEWLSSRRGKTVQLSYPRKEIETKVLRMADDNALYAFNRHKDTRVDNTLLEIKTLLQLDAVPHRIGAVDISNISGSEAVGAVVLYEGGKFRKDEYRLFRIKTVKGIDDFAMIGEVVSRYCRNISENNIEAPGLLLIDGGRGQLESSVSAMKPFDPGIEIASIAKAKGAARTSGVTGVRKDLERIYRPGRRPPIYLEPMRPSTHLIQRIRDEVHRFAISSHRKMRTKRTLESPLEKIKGIGKTRRLQLLKHFSSIDGIRQASVEDIAALKGMNRKVAELLKQSLGGPSPSLEKSDQLDSERG